MKLVYISGKYTDGRGMWYISKNIEKARDVSRYFMLQGYAVICPHTMSAYMDCDTMSWEKWLEIDKELVKRCDTIALLPGWADSKGALEEKRFAETYAKEIWYVHEIMDAYGELAYTHSEDRYNPYS